MAKEMRLAVRPHEANITLFYRNSTAFFNSLHENGNFIHDEQPVGHPGPPKVCLWTSSPVGAPRAGQAASLAVSGGRKSGVALRASEQMGQGVLVVPLVVSIFPWRATGEAGAEAVEPGGVRPALRVAQG